MAHGVGSSNNSSGISSGAAGVREKYSGGLDHRGTVDAGGRGAERGDQEVESALKRAGYLIEVSLVLFTPPRSHRPGWVKVKGCLLLSLFFLVSHHDL